MIPMIGGTHAHLPVDGSLREEVEGAPEKSIRVIKVVVSGEKLVSGGTLPETASLEDDFRALGDSLEDDKPCIALVRLKGCERASLEDAWAMVVYKPDNAPVKARMLNASSVKPVQIEFKSMQFEEYQATEKSEIPLSQFLESTK